MAGFYRIINAYTLCLRIANPQEQREQLCFMGKLVVVAENLLDVDYFWTRVP